MIGAEPGTAAGGRSGPSPGRLVTGGAIALGVLLLAAAIAYQAEGDSLPSGLGGHGAGAAQPVIDYGRGILLGLLQGVAELFPISSLGHSVVVPGLLGWDIGSNDDAFLTFLVATHLATALVLLGFFWNDWVRIVRGIARSLRDRHVDPEDTDAVLGWLLVVATIPAGIVGLLFEHPLRSLFTSPTVAAAFIVVNGGLLFLAERMRRRAPVHETGDPDGRIARRLSWRAAVGVGVAQTLALIPGISRSGVTMGAGLRVGLSNEDAARFSFLLATPIIGAAALLKLPDLFGTQGDGIRGPALAGSIAAAVSAYLSLRFLMRYFQTRRLDPFALYCVVAGTVSTIVLAAT